MSDLSIHEWLRPLSPSCGSCPRQAYMCMGTGQRVSTRQWAENNGYDPVMLFHKVRALEWFVFGQCFYHNCS